MHISLKKIHWVKNKMREIIKRRMRWLLIGGTSEAREAYEFLNGHGAEVLISSATHLGSQMFDGMNCKIHEGRLDEMGFVQLMIDHNITHILDSSHPYAVEVSKTVREAAKTCKIPYYRYTRSESVTEKNVEKENEKIIWQDDAESAAVYLNRQAGNIALLTGVNTLGIYSELISDFKERVYARVLNTAQSKKICEALWNDETHYICAMPPFSENDNYNFLQRIQADFMVTKDSGTAGGIPEKLAAAKSLGCKVVIIRRPEEKEQLDSLDELEGIFQ